jgi:DNA-binding LacI/PurR family transcriptional regulator
VPDAPPYHRVSSEVVLITRGEHGLPGLVTPRSHEHVRVLEQECSRRNLRLHIVTHDQVTEHRGGPKRLRGYLQSARPLGVLVWRVALTGPQVRALLTIANESALPCAVLDETGDALGFVPRHKTLCCRIFRLGILETAGRDVGCYLARLGHRRIAYIGTTQNQDEFSRARMRGMQAVFEAAGIRDAVVPCILDLPREMGDLLASNRYIQTTVDLFASAALMGEHLRQGFLTRAQELLRQLQRPDMAFRQYPELPSFLDSVLAHGDITAWVAENDPLALDCHTFLSMRQVGVPGRLSLVGFDDGMTALMQRMTSYSFGGDNVVREMLDFLQRPVRGMPTIVELPGRVVERRSSAAPREHAGALPRKATDTNRVR